MSSPTSLSQQPLRTTAADPQPASCTNKNDKNNAKGKQKEVNTTGSVGSGYETDESCWNLVFKLSFQRTQVCEWTYWSSIKTN